MNINKTKKIMIFLFMFSIIFALVGGSFAFLRWATSEEQRTSVTFSADVGFSCSANGGVNLTGADTMLAPTDCTNSKYAIQRELEVKATINEEGKKVYMNMWLEVVRLDEGLKNSANFKYAITDKNNSCTAGVISSGAFTGLVEGDRVNLFEEQTYVESSIDTYYLYIWLDKAETSTSVMDQSFEFRINGECSDKELEESFSVPYSNANYQLLNATAQNTIRNINSYAITKDTETPTEWIDIESNKVSKSYSLEHKVTETGTYNIWFKDIAGNTVSEKVEVTEIDNTAPTCTWGEFSSSVLVDGSEASIDLTCTDTQIGMDDINLTKEDITTNSVSRTISESIIVSELTRSSIDNGYKYTITVIPGTEEGRATLSLNSNKIKDKLGNISEISSSSAISYSNDVGSPTMTINVDNATEYTKSKTATITISDDNNLAPGTYNIKYGWSNNNLNCSDLTESATITVASNTNSASTNVTILTGTGAGKIYVCNESDISDGNSNVLNANTKTSANMYLDNAYPKIQLVSNTSDTYSQSQSFKLRISDENSGLKTGTYTLRYAYGTSTLKACTDIDNTNIVSLNVSTDGTTSVESNAITINNGAYSRIYICNSNELVDTLGNTRTIDTIAYDTLKVDANAPIFEFIASTDNKTYAKTQTFSFRISEQYSGLKAGTYTIKYALADSRVECANMTNSVTITVGNNGAVGYQVSEPITISSGTSKYLYFCNSEDIIDMAGNVKVANTHSGQYNMKLDNETPKIQVISDTKTTYAKSQSFKLRITDENSGLKAGTYTLRYAYGTSTLKACADIDNTNTVSLTVATNGTVSVDSNTITISSGAYSRIYICNTDALVDVAGNTRTIDTIAYDALKVDNNAPVVNISAITDRNTYAKSQTFAFKITENYSGLVAGTYTIKYALADSKVECADMTKSVSITVSDGAVGEKLSGQITINSGAYKYIYFCNGEDIADKAGNVKAANTHSGSYNMKIDNNAPALAFLGSTTPGTYAKSQTFKLRINENYSGIPAGTYKLKYALADSTVTCADMTESTTITVASDGSIGYQDSAEITINTGTSKYIYVCNESAIPDMAGNTRAASTRYYWTLKIDNSAPTGTVSTSLSNATVSATVSASDTGSGLSTTYGWKISKSSTCNSTTTGFTDEENTKYNFPLTSDGTYYVCVRSTDAAGNIGYIRSSAISYTPSTLYSPGNETTPLAGGWTASRYPYASFWESGYTYGSGVVPSITYGDSSMIISVTGNYASGTIYTNNKIDLTNYSKITLTGTLNNTSHPYRRVYLTTDVSSSFNYLNATYYKQLEKSGTTTFDISNVTGSYYVAIGMYTTSYDLGVTAGTDTYTVTSIKLS